VVLVVRVLKVSSIGSIIYLLACSVKTRDLVTVHQPITFDICNLSYCRQNNMKSGFFPLRFLRDLHPFRYLGFLPAYAMNGAGHSTDRWEVPSL